MHEINKKHTKKIEPEWSQLFRESILTYDASLQLGKG
jgi:hypothetical protein